MTYYLKEGQRLMFSTIKLFENECLISNLSTNITKRKAEKIIKKMKKKKIEQVVLSKQIKQNKKIIDELNNYDIIILDGKWLMQYLLHQIICYLQEKQQISNIDEITILANDLTNEVNKNIKKFANTYKKIRIVTNHLEKFNRFEEELYETNGISIIITNNKRKALSKSELIINFDFVQETINQYNIYEKAIIINLNSPIKINKKRFCGLLITDYEVELQNLEKENETKLLNLNDIIKKQNEFALKEILEDQIYSNIEKTLNSNAFETIENIIKKYNINISQLYGINRSDKLKRHTKNQYNSINKHCFFK